MKFTEQTYPPKLTEGKLIMKIEHELKTPKMDIEDYTRGEQKLLALIAAVHGGYKTDYTGVEKALSLRMNCINFPKVDALSELSGLSKNLIINEVLELGFRVLEENLKDEDFELFQKTESEKMQAWLQPEGYELREKK